MVFNFEDSASNLADGADGEFLTLDDVNMRLFMQFLGDRYSYQKMLLTHMAHLI